MQTNRKSRTFTYLALGTALLTVGLIVFGAIVRVTDSGLGCGNDWPLCDGRVVPPLDNLTAWIEWSHRLFAVLIGIFGLATLLLAWREFRSGKRLVFFAIVGAALLYVIQSALGALVVVLDLPPTMVTLHLGTAMLLLGALLVAVVASRYQPDRVYEHDHITLLAYTTTALSLVIILTGALVRGSGATLACTDWPLCNGSILPVEQGQLQMVHMIHRFAVAGLGITLILLVWYVLQARRGNRNIIIMAWLAFGLYCVQALVGALFVWTQAESVWGAVHVGLAAITWASLVILCVIETLNTLDEVTISSEVEWTSQSETATS